MFFSDVLQLLSLIMLLCAAVWQSCTCLWARPSLFLCSTLLRYVNALGGNSSCESSQQEVLARSLSTRSSKFFFSLSAAVGRVGSTRGAVVGCLGASVGEGRRLVTSWQICPEGLSVFCVIPFLFPTLSTNLLKNVCLEKWNLCAMRNSHRNNTSRRLFLTVDSQIKSSDTFKRSLTCRYSTCSFWCK